MPGRPIVVINHLLEPPNRITGVTRFLFAILGQLARRPAFDYLLLTTWDIDKLPNAIVSSGVRVLTRPYYPSLPYNVLRQTLLLPRLIREVGAAIEFSCNPVGGLWPTWPRVITTHDLYFNLIPDAFAVRHRLWWRLLFPLSLAQSAKVICVSGSTREDLRRFYPRYADKGIVVYEASAILDAGPTAAVSTMNRPYAIYVGNMAPNKNPRVLADALKILETSGHAVSVYHVGSDDRSLLANALAAAGVAGPVKLMGNATDSTLIGLYRNANCLVVTSTHEGFCLPIVEAQSLGTPVICSDIPVLREIAGSGGIFFAPNDAEALAHHVHVVFSDAGLRERMSILARQNSARFSWQRAAEEAEAIFQCVLESASH